MVHLLALLALGCHPDEQTPTVPSETDAQATGDTGTAGAPTGDTGVSDTATPDTGSHDTAATGHTGTGAETGDTGAPPPPLVDCDAIAVRADGLDTFYESNPIYSDPEDRLGPYPVVTPAQARLDATLLAEGTTALGLVPFVNSFMVFRDGALGWEEYLHGSGPQQSNNIHSSSKSILGATFGIAVAEGLVTLDDPVAMWLPAAFAGQADARKASITIRHLLTMTSGFEWEEDATEYVIEQEPDWVQAIVDLPLVADPGVRFNYCSGNTHLLSAVLQAASGTTTCDYVHDRLFRPLDIAAEHWGRDPQGVYSGGYNVYLTPRELARFGLLVAQDGSWEGAQVLDPAWVAEMLSPLASDLPYHYGYLWWMRELDGYETKIAWGYGGQLIYLVPELDLMAVFTTDTHDWNPWFFDAELAMRWYVIPAAEAYP